MFNVEMTINGKPFSETTFKDEMEKTVFQSVVESAKESVISLISEEELSKISIDVVGTDLKNLSLRIDGPDEIVNKIQTGLDE